MIFASPMPDPKEVGKEDLGEAGIFQIDSEGKLFSLIIYADHRRLAVDSFCCSTNYRGKSCKTIGLLWRCTNRNERFLKQCWT